MRADISVKETGGRNSLPTDRWLTAAGQIALIKAGEPAKQNAAGGEAIILLEDADMTIDTDNPMAGIAAIDSSDTVAAAGYVDCYVPLPDIKWEIKAKSAAAADTQAEIDALVGCYEIIDLTGGVFTMDTTGLQVVAGAFLTVGGDPNRSTIWFRIRPAACAFGRAKIT